jgi:lysozyme family protein
MEIIVETWLGNLLLKIGAATELNASPKEEPKPTVPSVPTVPSKPIPVLNTKIYENAKPIYTELWARCEIKPEKLSAVRAECNQILKNKAQYEKVSAATGVPWDVIGCIHMLECGGRFDGHLHNGNSLKARTVDVPAGRPVKGNPPFTWFESAVDALGYDGLTSQKDWSIERILHMLTAYNGFGYVSKGINSPYLWSFSSTYTKGKYTSDGVYSATAVSDQVGAACILKLLRS